MTSHPGLTYGGLLHPPRCAPELVREMLEAAATHYAARGYRLLRYKSVPPAVHRTCVQADLHALWLGGARLVRRDLWNVIELGGERHAAPRHARDARHGARLGLQVSFPGDESAYREFHSVLAETLARRHGVEPVHSVEEMLDIRRRCPDRVQLWCCRTADGDLVAGIWLFVLHTTCWHTQYVAASDRGRASFATDVLLAAVVDGAVAAGVRVLTQGTSTQGDGRVLNTSLFRFKSGPGAGSQAHDFYELPLAAASA